MIEHKQTTILDPTSKEMVEVDEGLAPLLEAIWDFGIVTLNSCQENKPGIIWIEFLAAKDLEAFLTRVISGLGPVNSSKTDGELYSRILGENGGWQYNVHPHDSREYIDEEKSMVELNNSEPCRIALSISIRFPVGDYERLIDIVSGQYQCAKLLCCIINNLLKLNIVVIYYNLNSTSGGIQN